MTATRPKSAVSGGRPPQAAGGNDAVFDLEAPSSHRRVRVPEIAAGVLLITLCALGALWWQARSNPKVSVLVAAATIERGQVIELSDLGVVEIEAREPITTISADDSEQLVGGVALTTIESGAVLAPSLIGATADLGPDEVVVGLFVGPGRIPSLALAPGSVVDIVVVDPATELGGEVVARNARVVSVDRASTFGQMMVSVVVADGEAVATAIAASQDRVVLIEVPEDRP